MHRLVTELPSERPSGRIPLQGAPAARVVALRGHALGHSPSLAAVRRQVRALGRTHGSCRVLDARSTQRGSPRAPRSHRRSALCLSGRWSMGADLGLASPAPPTRRAAGTPRDGGKNPVPQVQHRPVRARDGTCGGRGARAQACRRGGGQGLRSGRRRWAHRWRQPRDEEHRVGARPFQLGVPRRLERLRYRPACCLERGARFAGRLVRTLRVAGHRY